VALSDLFSRRRKEHADPEAGASDAPVYPTKVLARFIAGLSTRSQPVLLDLGPVVGANVSFFGEQLGCKIIVEDVSKDIDRHVRDGLIAELPAFLARRFPQESGSIDGILCWDLFDYLDKASAKPLAEQLTRLLRPDGVLLAFFSTAEPRPGARPEYTRHVVVNQTNLQHRPYAAARPKQRPLPNREIQRLFEPLHVVEQFLLKTNLREVLFRKASEPSAGAPAPPHA
jgi:SAM-dependent methyltransferase